MDLTEYPTKTELTEVEKEAMERYARAFLDGDSIPEELDIPDNTKNWRRALLDQTEAKVFEGINPLESINEITQRNISEIHGNDNLSAVVCDGYWDDKFLLTDSTVSDPSTVVPAEYTFYQL